MHFIDKLFDKNFSIVTKLKIDNKQEQIKVSECLWKMKNLKTNFCWFTVLLFECNEGKMGFLTKILLLNEI